MSQIKDFSNNTEELVEEQAVLIEEYEWMKGKYLKSEKLLQQILSNHEKENKSISEELYHVIGQMLYSLLIGLKLASDSNADESLKDYLIRLEEATDEVLRLVRKLSFDLYPLSIEDIGFVETLKTFIRLVESDQFFIDLQIEGEKRKEKYSVEKEAFLYRICQETIWIVASKTTIKVLPIVLSFYDKKQVTVKFEINAEAVKKNDDVMSELFVIPSKRLKEWNGEMKISQDMKQNEKAVWIVEFIIPNKL